MESNLATRSSRYRAATRAAALGLFINLGLGLVKLVGGVISGSFALIADAVNSLGDVFTSVVVLFAFRVAQRPADAEHPYGHTRAEAIAASNVALLIIISAGFVGWEAIARITRHHDLPPAWTLWIAAANVVIKEALYRYKKRVGERTQSAALVANAWDHRSDALSALAVLVGLGVVRWAGPDYRWADEAAALFVVAAIVWSGCQLFRQGAAELMDAQANPDLCRSIHHRVLADPDVRAIDTLRVLRDKTKGNLDEDESQHLEEALAELHQLFATRIRQYQEQAMRDAGVDPGNLKGG